VEKFGAMNPHAIPGLEKVVVNMGVGVAITEKKYLDEAISAMAQITGQKPIATLSRIAVAGFKLRENLPIGCKVTLRGRRMWEFLDRLVSIALPRVRDFRGLPATAFDGNGNYSLGLSEQMVFPEINPDRFTRPPTHLQPEFFPARTKQVESGEYLSDGPDKFHLPTLK